MTVAVEADAALLDAVRRIADDVAAPNAADVDREARFPSETIDALRAERALSAFVPERFGGAGVSFEALAEACFELGRRCGASAMVFAMHQIEVVTIVRHLDGNPYIEQWLRDLVAEQRLVASITSEIGTGGDMGRSIAAVTPQGDGTATFEKQAPTVSYGAHADDFLTTVRSGPDADAGDQVLVLTRAEQTEREQKGTWDPLGMRGTCSPGFTVRARFDEGQVLGTPFATIMCESMVPVTHILWSHLWLGIATDAFDRARAFTRAAARRTPGETPPAAQKLSRVMTDLSLLRAEVGSALREFVAADEDREQLHTFATKLRFNNLKIAASETAPQVCQGALGVGGIASFLNNTPFSVGRHLRDTMSAALMVTNERIHDTNAGLLLIAKDV
ncbi:MAG TPA: acyl-CoA dehydrogenase family protein [Solirubrobacteraceae bacterium]|nr:acyl-CoA dehydrogenase family protein [Solirubrobacteraceae bacterium]